MRLPALAFLLALLVFGAVAGPRLASRSHDPHFILQADAWLRGRLDIPEWPDGADDPAVVDVVVLDDGRVVRGRPAATRNVFLIAGDGEVPLTAVRGARAHEFHLAFPPFPAVAALPFVAMFGPQVSDVAITVVAAALAPALCLLVFARLRAAGLVTRPPADDLSLSALFAVGTVFFFSAVQGRIWFTAHIVAVDLCLLYVWASVDARYPALAGACVGLAFLTRAPMLFMVPLFAGEAWRAGKTREWRTWTAFVVPVAVAGALAAWFNVLRFDDPLQFGHIYIRARQQVDIERFGLFNVRYLWRNAVAAFGLLPQISSSAPFVRVSGHGLAVWVTTPALFLLARERPRRPIEYSLWATVLAVGAWTLLYQNTGWFQFGFRFALDYLVFLVVLLALQTRPLGRLGVGLVVLSIAVNTFGALTFDRSPQFYRGDAEAYRALVHD